MFIKYVEAFTIHQAVEALEFISIRCIVYGMIAVDCMIVVGDRYSLPYLLAFEFSFEVVECDVSFA